MIIPDNNQLPPDDSDEQDMDDQQSQQDIHSNGFDTARETDENTVDEQSSIDMLQQASDASEPSFTLDIDRDKPRGDQGK